MNSRQDYAPTERWTRQECKLIELALFGTEHEIAVELGLESLGQRQYEARAVAAEYVRDHPREAVLNGLAGTNRRELAERVRDAPLATLPIDLASIADKARRARERADESLADYNLAWREAFAFERGLAADALERLKLMFPDAFKESPP